MKRITLFLVIVALFIPLTSMAKSRLLSSNGQFKFDVVSTQTISGQFSTDTGKTITVYWGDGTSNTYSGTDQAYSKDYGSAGNRVVTITNASVLTKFTMTQSGANIRFYLAQLPRRVTYFYVTGSNTITGNLSSIPAGNTYFYVGGYNTITGNLSSIPSGCTYFIVTGSNTITGNLSSIPAGNTYFLVGGSNTINAYTSKTWTTKPTTFYVVPVAGGGLSEAEVNQLLIDLDEDLTWAAGNTITLAGTNAAPSGLGVDAKNHIISEGATVTTK